jgi:hypothetical protein
VRFLAIAMSDDSYFSTLDDAKALRMGRAEARRVWELYESGVIREINFRVDRNDVVMLLEAADEAGAQEALASLPYVQAGGLTFEVMGLRPYDGWSRLFGG